MRLGAHPVHCALQTGNPACCVAGVNNILATGLVQHGCGALQGVLSLGGIVGLNGFANGLDGILDAGFHHTIAQVALQALTMPFESGLVVSQNDSPKIY